MERQRVREWRHTRREKEWRQRDKRRRMERQAESGETKRCSTFVVRSSFIKPVKRDSTYKK